MLPLSKQAALEKMIGRRMEVGQAGMDLICSFEGFSPVLYNDPSPLQNCSVGYGFLVHQGPCNGAPSEAPYLNGITEAQGQTILKELVAAYADCVSRTTDPVNQNQFDALVSLCYNIGQGGYINSSVRAAVNNGGNVAGAFREYVYAGGVALPGLIRRRETEIALYFTEEERMYSDQQIDAMFAERDDKITKLYNAIMDHAKWIGNLYNAVIDHAKRLAALDGK